MAGADLDLEHADVPVTILCFARCEGQSMETELAGIYLYDAKKGLIDRVVRRL